MKRTGAGRNQNDFAYVLRYLRNRANHGIPPSADQEKIISYLAKLVDSDAEPTADSAKLQKELWDDLYSTIHKADRILVTAADRDHSESIKQLLAEFAASLLAIEVEDGDGPRLVVAPGGWMRDFAGTVFSNKVKEDVFDQIVADFRDEYCEALHAGARRPRMFFVVGRHWLGFAFAVGMQIAREIGRLLKAAKGAG